MGKSKTKEKEFAKTLYLDPNNVLTIKEIAERVGVRPNTVSNWITSERWDKMRKSLMVTRKKMISDLYDQLEWLNNDIKKRKNKVATNGEANTIAVITTSIKRLESEISIAEVYEVATDFLQFIKPQHPQLFKKLIPLFDAYINTKLN